jgi:hypothetical protein
MSVDNRIKMFPDILSDGSFQLPEDISEKMRDIYEMIDTIPHDPEMTDILLDDYNSGYLKAIEEILVTPMGVFNETVLKMLQEVHTNMTVNYDNHVSGESDIEESVDKTREKPDKDPTVFERVMTEITRKTVEPDDNDDISDEDMLKFLPDK